MEDGVCLVTGASRGIGAAIALLAGSQGYRVCVNYANDGDAAAEVVRRIEAAGGVARAVRADVADEAEVDHLFAEADSLGRLALLVNNAGIPARYGPVAELDPATTRRMIEVNVLGPLLCCRAAVRRMATDRGGAGGSIVNISSAAARIGGATEWVDYASTKGAMDTLTLGLAREVASVGIRVNAIRPGLIDTDFNHHASPGRLDRLAPTVPMGRAGTADEVADAALWFAGPGASFTTGAILDISGGR